jgi:hypothetical protein
MARKTGNHKRSYKKVSLHLSKKQVNSLNNYCEINNLTPNKLIKNLLKSYVEDYTDEKIGKEEADKRQLNLFSAPKAEDFEQLSLFSGN